MDLALQCSVSGVRTPITQVHAPIVRIRTVWPAPSFVMPLLREPLASTSLIWDEFCWRSPSPGGEPALPGIWVASVSRSTGKLDSTPKRERWQVTIVSLRAGTGTSGTCWEGLVCYLNRKRHPSTDGASLSCAGHWPPKVPGAVVFPPSPIAGLPAGLSHL
jgi:hypothetical protein